jgi:patatin-like phospholipase/acyl hydrolase
MEVSLDQIDFHIVALSGGGFKGLYTATVLKGMEEHCKGPIATHFDLLCGTSIGGIIALALAYEIPSTRLCEIFKKRRHEIFKSNCWRRLRELTQARYSNKGLRNVLVELFGKAKIKDLKHRVMIPSINFTKGTGQFFKTQHHADFKVDGERLLVDVALATSAAPIYFPMYSMDDGLFVDGGLVGNAPGFFGLHEAIHFLGANESHIRVLSVGTLSKKLTARTKENPNAGLLAWSVRIMQLTIAAQEASTDYLLRHHLKDRYCHIDADLTKEQARGIELDTVTDSAVTLLEQRGRISSQEFLGSKDANTFLNHIAPQATFYENGIAHTLKGKD